MPSLVVGMQTSLALEAMIRNGTFLVLVIRSTQMDPELTVQLRRAIGRQQERIGLCAQGPVTLA